MISVGSNRNPIIIASGYLSPITTITVVISSNTSLAPLIVNGTIGLDGVLVIVLNDKPARGTYVLPIIESGGFFGNFSRIDTIGSTICVEASTKIIGIGTLAVLLEICGDSSINKRLSTGAIAGISIGAIMGGALIVFTVLLIVKRIKPSGKLFNSADHDKYVI